MLFRKQKRRFSTKNTNYEPTGTIDGHGYVDLGLSVDWATCNLGATAPSDYGDYYAWGDIKPKSWHTMWKSNTYRRNIDSIAGNPEYDAATANWGGSWRLPKIEDINELIHQCDWELTTLYGNRGCKVTGPTGNSIFLPAAGKHCRWSPFHRAGTCGRYWIALPVMSRDGGEYYGKYLRFSSVRFSSSVYFKFVGYSVRPVSGEKSPQVSPADGVINGYGYVDLGLSVKWATCNVGASEPSDYGDYFAWGEIEPKSENKKRNRVTDGEFIPGIAGNSQYDAARAFWGGSWRLPTATEIDELVSKCTRKWTTINGHNGYMVTGPNGNSIFFPANWFGGELGLYWSATPYEEGTKRAFDLLFGGGYFNRDWANRRAGQSVRPVTE